MKELDQFTVEQLEKYSKLEALTFPPSHAQVAALARIALAVKTSKLNSPETPDGWVACAERMPAEGDTVLVCQEGGIVYCAEMEGGVLYPDEFPRVPAQGREITHWMPLPAPPAATTELLEG